MNAKLLDKIRAKSEGSDLLLKDHVLRCLERVRQLRKFVEKNKLNLPFEDKEKFFESLTISLFIHDLGKINYEFQKKVYNRKEWNEQQDLNDLKNFLKGSGKIEDHEIISAIWSTILIDEDDEMSQFVRSAILLHHYNEFYSGDKDLAEIIINYRDDIYEYLNFLNKNWDKVSEILKELKDYVVNNLRDESIEGYLEKINLERTRERLEEFLKLIEERGDLISFAKFYDPKALDQKYYSFMVFAGLLRRCDYSASGDLEVEVLNKTLEDTYSIIESGIKRRLGEELWQYEVLKKYDGKSAILIAPTGSGKTEFSLLWNKSTGKKMIYTLPLRVALNDLYRRFVDYSKLDGYREDEFVGLLHSTAFTEVLDREKGETSIGKKVESSKLLSYPLILSTPDQIFLVSLNFYGSDRIISVFPYSALVLDEIQCYNPEMAAIIIRTLKIAEILGSKILVMTATLPPYFKPFFGREEKNFPLNEKDSKILNNHIINVAFVDTEGIKTKIKNYCNNRHRVKLLEDTILSAKQNGQEISRYEINREEVERVIEEIWNSGKKSIVFVLNNVSKAIELYKALKDKPIKSYKPLKDFSIFLLHSRMLEIRKSRVIEEIREKLNNKEKFILVTTQVIEVSIDFDFDAMVTEISPIDSQIQRWGRVWRNRDNGKMEYSDPEPNIYVFCTKSENTNFDKGTRAIYSGKINEQLLSRTLQKIKEIEGKLLNYEEERKLVEEVFNEKFNGKTLACHYLEEILGNIEFLNYVKVEKKSQAQKIFRNIAGVQVIIPQAMLTYSNEMKDSDPMKEILSSLANFLNNIEKDNKKLSWDEIEEFVGIEKERGGKWILRKLIIDFSVNVPMFYFEKIKNRIVEFKGFYVLKVDKKYAKKILEFGIDEFLKEEAKILNEEDEVDESYYLF